MKQISREILDVINGCECISIKYEGCVSIKGYEVIQYGKVIDTLNNDSKVSEIWDEIRRDQ